MISYNQSQLKVKGFYEKTISNRIAFLLNFNRLWRKRSALFSRITTAAAVTSGQIF